MEHQLPPLPYEGKTVNKSGGWCEKSEESDASHYSTPVFAAKRPICFEQRVDAPPGRQHITQS